ncbi:hypothetical protein DNI29_01220 [Hymenobacter sediminis]|uniref:carboxypeptidase regulatory-like domain-containing protein n=1 Tax=Hymenobacter sediminis TaxID=2218621 RepID=UPI000DA6B395|nr:carboxypeptidase regulatory-like domain-containing protein [Hymenobacter sediminis]RPD49452.1 hypothetical protein DNI29_01220 [Hymenobacter sediminis]
MASLVLLSRLRAGVVGCSLPLFCLLMLAGSSITRATAQTTAGSSVTSPASSGTVQFTGAVFSEAGQPLPGATVSVVGKATQLATTNAEGFFLLPLPAGVPVRFIVAYPGHVPQQVELRAPEAEKNLVVTLQTEQGRSGKAGRKPGKGKRN